MKFKILLLSILLLVIFCNQNTDNRQIVNELPGKWKKTGLVKSCVIQKEWSLGVAEGNAPQEFYHPKDFTIDAEGNVYVLDSGNFRIKVFDNSGKYKYEFGNQGMGPGELSNMATKIKFVNKDTLFVVDSKYRRISFYDNNGKFLTSFNVETYIDDVLMINENKYIIANFVLDNNHQPIKLFDINNRKITKSFGVIIEPGHGLIPKVKNTPNQYFFSYGGLTHIIIDKSEFIYYLQKFPYLVQKYDIQGRKLIEFTRVTNFSTLTNIDFEKLGERRERWSLNKPSATTGGIQILNDSLIVTSIFSPDKSDNSVDFFDLNGKLLLSVDISSQFDGPQTSIIAAKIDEHYNFYCLFQPYQGYPKLEKYSITLY